MKASELFKASPFLKVLVYGSTGSGKTSWAARAPRPLILLTERQGLASIVRANQDAHVILIEDYRHFLRLMDDLLDGREEPLEDGQPAFSFSHADEEYSIQTLVLDSLSDLHERGRREYGNGEDVNWFRVQDEMRHILDDLRSLPVNLVALCLADEDLDDGNRRRITPMLYGRIKRLAGQWFSAVGYAARKERDSKVTYGIIWNAGSSYDTKPGPGWPSWTVNDLDANGETTLGSILLWAHGDNVAHEESDSAGVVQAQVDNEKQMDREKRSDDKQQRRQPRRRG